MDDDALSGLLAALEPEWPFGELQRNSGCLLNEVGHAQIRGAQNLLTKAARTLSRGEEQQA